MTKIRKQKRRKTYNTSINRKRLRNRLENVGNIECLPIKRAWNNTVSARTNLKNMGLAYDANEVMKIPNYKDMQKRKAIAIKCGDFTVTEEVESLAPSRPVNTTVLDQLVREAKAPRQNNLRLPKAQVDYVTYLMDKYGTDYKAMARDRKNYYQETWKQIRAKIKKFMSSPLEYGKYLAAKNLLDDNDDEVVKKEAESFAVDSD